MNTAQVQIGIIQLTRIGDLVQTAQAARQFKAENPHANLTLIARRKFASGIMPLLESVFQRVVLFDTKDFFTRTDLKTARINTHNLIHDLNKTDFDVLLNFSFSKSSSYLAGLLQSKHYLGIRRNRRSEIVVEDKWSQFVYSNVLGGINNPFSLVDIYRYMLGCKSTHQLNDSEEFESRSKSIVLHPFASLKKKRWGLHKWNELIFKLSKDNPDYTIHIVGGPEDLEEARRIESFPALQSLKNKIKVHVGTASLMDTYTLVQNSRLFIGHDSVVSHLAAETLTPTIVLSLGSVRPHETTPYQVGVLNLVPKNKCFPCTVQESCELLPCHSSISHQVVATLAKAKLNSIKIDSAFLENNISPFQIDSLKILESSYDENGLHLKQLTKNFSSTNDIFKDYYKLLFQYYIRGTEVNIELPKLTPETSSQLRHYAEGTKYLYELYNFGVRYCDRILKESKVSHPNQNNIQEDILKINEIDKLCDITKKSYPILSPFIDFFYIHKGNAKGNNIIDITENNLLTYYDASNIVAALHDFIERTLGPQVIKSEVNREV